MTRREMIEILVEDRLNDWVFARNYDELEEILWDGWLGYGEYTDGQIQEEMDVRLEQGDIKRLQSQIKWRKEENKKREKDEKKGIYKDPFE